jgi:hypothetical protein
MWLRQSTAFTLPMGPFVSATDGVTPQNSLGLVATDVRVSKNGNAFTAKSDATAPTILENGHYVVTGNATDSGTLGKLRIAIYKSGALPVWIDCEIVPAAVWDAYFAAGTLSVAVASIAANAITATAIQANAIDNTKLATDCISSAQIATGGAQEIAAAVKALVIETAGSYTVGQALSIMLAVLAGRTSSSGATIATPDGSATRIAATIDSSNNRTSMSLTPST